jgi:hypothetical protein
MTISKTDQKFDQILGRMLATPPTHKVGSVRKKTKKKGRKSRKAP